MDDKRARWGWEIRGVAAAVADSGAVAESETGGAGVTQAVSLTVVVPV